MRCDNGHKMSTVIGVGLWQASCECGVFTVSLSGKNCSLRLTPLALDAAMPPSAEPDSGLESVPAVEFDTQPRK